MSTPKPTFPQIAKNPQTWVMILVLNMAIGIFWFSTRQSNKESKTWKKLYTRAKIQALNKNRFYEIHQC